MHPAAFRATGCRVNVGSELLLGVVALFLPGLFPFAFLALAGFRVDLGCLFGFGALSFDQGPLVAIALLQLRLLPPAGFEFLPIGFLLNGGFLVEAFLDGLFVIPAAAR